MYTYCNISTCTNDTAHVHVLSTCIFVLFSRHPCSHSNSLKDMDWNPSSWQSLISDRYIHEHFLSNNDGNTKQKQSTCIRRDDANSKAVVEPMTLVRPLLY